MRKILSLLMLLLLTTAGSWAQEVHLVKRGNSTLLTADLAAKTDAGGTLYVALQQHVVDKVGNQNVTYERYISGTGAMTPDFDYAGGTTTWKVIRQGDGYVLQNSTGNYLKNNGNNQAATFTANLAEATVYMVSDWGGNSASMLVSGYNQNQALKWEVKNQTNLKINTNSSPIIHNTGTGGYTKIFTYEVEKKTITPISFNPNITYQEGRTTDGSRYLNSIALQSSGRTQTISAGFTNLISSKQYLNLTNQHFTVGAGRTVKPIINWTGAYMHGMVYIDLNHDGDFSDEGENVANSALAGSPNLATGIATFTAPAEGDYLMRFKVDWQDTAPAGNSNICKNGGSITDVMLRVRNTANITLNITGDVTRNVPMNDLPEDTYDVATLLGAAMPSYITFTPSSITTSTTDSTFNISCTQSLPFATDGTQYFMNMGGKYATTENTNSLQSTFLQIQNSYLWTFSGNAIDGFKLYNVGAGAYAKVNDDTDNSVATFVSEGEAPYFELSASSYNDGTGVGGFCLKLAGTTNCYLNDRDSKLSTWKDNRGTNAYGSMFKFESVNSFILAKLTALTKVANYVGGVQAEALEDGHTFKTKLEAVKAAPTVDGFNEVFTLAANDYKVAPVDGAYYRIVSAYSGFSQEKAVYNDGGTMNWKAYDAEDASMVLKFIKNGDKWKIYVPSADAYMDGNTGATTTYADSAANYTFTDFGYAMLNINDSTGNLHAYNHGNGANSNGTLINYGSGVDGASAWYVIRYGNEVSEDTLIAPYQTSVDTVYQTYATSEKVIVANPGVKVYKVTGVAGEKATIVEAGTSVVPASTGVILSGERSKTFTMLRVTTDVASQYADNKLVQGDGTAKTGDFVLAYREKDTDAYFYKIGSLVIPANRAYLPANSGSSTVAALSLNFGDDDELTAIESLPAQAESAQGQAFDLQGRRVSKLQKGIYIVGGKKVMVK